MQLNITSLERNDIPELCSLCNLALPHDTLSPEDLSHGIFNDPHPDPSHTLVARAGGEMVGALNGAGRPQADRPDVGLVKLFAVQPACHRQGVATALFDRFEQLCGEGGVETIQVGCAGPLYFFAGVDPRYSEAVLFLMQRGYEKQGDSFYLSVDLRQPLPRYDGLIDELAQSGITFHRPDHEQEEEVTEWVRSAFGDGWAYETMLGFRNELVSVWIARADGAPCGFAASNATARDYFGPTGVAPDFRRCGIGRVLVVKCLEDMQRDGRAIAWIPTGLGRLRYYHLAGGARVGRVFWPFAKALQASEARQ